MFQLPYNDLLTLPIYFILILIPIILARYIDHDKYNDIYFMLITINFRKLVYGASSIAIMQQPRKNIKLLDKLKENVIRGYRNCITTKSTSGSVKLDKFLEIICDNNYEVALEASKALIDNYKLLIYEKTKNTEIKLTILVAIYVFFPLLGLMAYSISQSIVYSIILLTTQILISEILIRK